MKKSGFTVLEFLIVITIVGILIAIVLVSLSASRERARDDERIARLQNVSVALEQFYTDCREYPEDLVVGYQCPNNTNLTLGNYISDLVSNNWNASGSDYKYQPLTYVGGDTCTGYHLSVQLENTGNAFALRDAQFDSVSNVPSTSYESCGSSGTVGVRNGLDAGVYDIKR